MQFKNFGDDETKDIFLGKETKQNIRLLHPNYHSRAQEFMDKLNDGQSPKDMSIYKPEKLNADGGEKGNWWSLRITGQDRVACIWNNENNEAYFVQVTDYHD